MRLVVAALLALSFPSVAAAAPGPPLREDPAALTASLECSPEVATSSRRPVVLVHGTTSSPEDSFSWGYRKVLPELGIPACTVRLPERGTVDLQRASEYVVHGVRRVAARSPAGRVSVVGHSQGAFHAVFTAKYWPDLPGLVDDVVALAGPFREVEGTTVGCNPASCSPPFRQRQKGAVFFREFLAALLPPGPSFTSVLTLEDQVTSPQPASSTLPPTPGVDVRTIVLQDVCPGRDTDHTGMIEDGVVFALVLDALGHAGTADPARARPDCAAEGYPGIDEAGRQRTLPGSAANLVLAGVTADQSPTEPPVRCWVRLDCADVAERGAMVPLARVGRRLRLQVAARGSVLVTVRRGSRVLSSRRRTLDVGRHVLTLPRAAARGAITVSLTTRPAPYAVDTAELTVRRLRTPR